jgi:hypothetical protein
MRTWMMLATIGLVACGSESSGAPDAGGQTPVDAGAEGAVTEHDVAYDVPADGERCAAAAEQLLLPIDLVSNGDVTLLADGPGKKTLYVDASAGGTAAQSMNARIYVNLEMGTKIAVTDKTARGSLAWDLAIKRPILFANGGDGGPGQGSAVFLAGKDFENVSAADAAGQNFWGEGFFESDCAPKLDATGVVRTSFDGWYEYDSSNNTLAPAAGTWLVKGGTGKLYKVRFLSYYATPDGGVGQAGGRYTLDVGAL